MDHRKQIKPRNTLKELILRLERFNKEGIINALSIQNSGMNDCDDYTRVSFKIPKNK